MSKQEKYVAIKFSREELSILEKAMRIGVEDGSLYSGDDDATDKSDNQKFERICDKISRALTVKS